MMMEEEEENKRREGEGDLGIILSRDIRIQE
jgi:hypothetical protein